MWIVALLLVTAAPAAAADAAVLAPPNDAFANATGVTVAQLPYTSNVNGAGATVEPMEPPDACAGDFETVWYRITPATTMYLRADTMGSADDALITIFRGTALSSLVEVDCNDNAMTDSEDARITFKATGGLTYYIRVSLVEAGLVVHIQKVVPPANDPFATAKAVKTLPFSQSTSTATATREPNEPDPEARQCAWRGPTIWYRFKPGTTMRVRVDVPSADFDPWIAVFRGTSLTGLTPIDCNDDTAAVLPNVAFRAVAGKTYYFQVGGYDNQNGPLTVRVRKIKTPLANDNFAKAQAISANGATREILDTGKATTQAGEPQGSCFGRSSASVWYSFTPSAGGSYTLDATATDYLPVISVFTGSSLTGLTNVGCNFRKAAFSLTAGKKYYIRIAGYFGDSGHLSFKMAPTGP
jgi:hypothetical protein